MKLNLNPYRLFVAIMFLMVAMMVLGMLTGCSSTKKISTYKQTYDSSYIYQLQDSVKFLKQETEILNQELTKKDLTEIEFEKPTPCPQIELPANLDLPCDSLKEVIGYLKSKINEYNVKVYNQINTITKLQDGSIEYKGAISKYKNDNSFKDKIIQQKQSTIDSLVNKLQSNNTNVTAAVETKEVEKKVVVFPWYFWLITGGFALLWLNKQFKIFG